MIAAREQALNAPFPWFGGKSRAVPLIWERFGDVPNYCEPFAGSLAVLLLRPHAPRTETVNDLDCYLANFWRAVKAEPSAVAGYADWPVNEADMLARHRWLIDQVEFRNRMKADPDFYDVKIAGWWVWGVNIWIGDGWCRHKANQIPHLGNPGRGVHRRLPHLGDPGKGAAIEAWFLQLSRRLERVRIACGEWYRVLSDSVTTKHGTTAVLLDPPYESRIVDYAEENDAVAINRDVRQWAIENGTRRDMRIALCGYEGAHEMPADWELVHWKARKGYQKVNESGDHTGHLERIWFSPYCLKPNQWSLF